MFWTGTLIVVAAALVGAGRLWAEGKERKGPRTRVALVNLSQVIKNYEKYKNFQAEVQAATRPFQEREKKLRSQAEKLAKGMRDTPVVPAKAEDTQEKLRKIQRELEDNQLKAKKAIARKNDEAIVTIYKEITEAAKRYAAVHDFDVVMHYNDAVTEEELNNPINIARKLQSGPLMPLYAAPGIDISKELLDVLNQGTSRE
jgi:Skp family chaperone for outer membrane proteins